MDAHVPQRAALGRLSKPLALPGTSKKGTPRSSLFVACAYWYSISKSLALITSPDLT